MSMLWPHWHLYGVPDRFSLTALSLLSCLDQGYPPCLCLRIFFLSDVHNNSKLIEFESFLSPVLTSDASISTSISISIKDAYALVKTATT